MASVTGVAVAGCLLLVAAGLAKLWRPTSLARAFAVVGMPGGAASVRLAAAVEVAVGVTALATGWRPAWMLGGLCYLVFALFVVAVRRQGGALASCGCFGGAHTPATRLHVAVSAVYAAVLGLTAVAPGGVSFAVAPAAVVVAYLTHAVLAVMPRVRVAAVRG